MDDPYGDEMSDEYLSQPENIFHSINSKTSIIKQIEGIGVEGSSPWDQGSHSSSAKRRNNYLEKNSASSGLKWGKT